MYYFPYLRTTLHILFLYLPHLIHSPLSLDFPHNTYFTPGMIFHISLLPILTVLFHVTAPPYTGTVLPAGWNMELNLQNARGLF